LESAAASRSRPHIFIPTITDGFGQCDFPFESRLKDRHAGLPLVDLSPRSGNSDCFAEWERIRRGSWRCLGSDPEVLECTHGRESAHPPREYFDRGRNALAVHPRRGGSGEGSARIIQAGFGSARTSREQGIQLDLFLGYASNVKLDPKFQEYFRKSKPPLLAIWSKNDPFIPAGAEAYRKDIPSARFNSLTRDILL
jgi:hypothetical protein